jgi:hypothetical protein
MSAQTYRSVSMLGEEEENNEQENNNTEKKTILPSSDNKTETEKEKTETEKEKTETEKEKTEKEETETEEKDNDDGKDIIKEKDIVIEILDILVTNKNISSIQLTKKQIDVLNIIIANSPSLIKDINTSIISIIKDGRIDALDIPQLIILIKEFYTFCHKESTIKINIKELVEVISPLIKYIIHIILNKNHNDTPELLSCCDRLVDVCMEIIQLQSSLKNVGCELRNIFSCL